jgi:hypothetical protein
MFVLGVLQDGHGSKQTHGSSFKRRRLVLKSHHACEGDALFRIQKPEHQVVAFEVLLFIP